MKTVLSIDASSYPPRVVVASVGAPELEVFEVKSYDNATLFSRSELLKNPQDQNEDSNTAEELRPDWGSHSRQIDETILIIPPLDYTSFGLELPFKDPKKLLKIIQPEVQDILPFELEEFFIDYRVIRDKSTPPYHVHVSALPRRVLKNALGACAKYGIDPSIITTPTSIISGVADLCQLPAAESRAFVLFTGEYCFITTSHNGVNFSDRAIDLNSLFTADFNGHFKGVNLDVKQIAIIARVRLELFALEKQLGSSLEQIVLVDSPLPIGEVERVLGRSLVSVSTASMLPKQAQQAPLALLAALALEERTAKNLLANFRTREFSFRPPIKEILTVAKSVAPYFVSLILLAVLLMLTQYVVNQFRISKLKATLAHEIRGILPGISIPPGDEFKVLSSETEKISDALKDLTPPTAGSPDQILARISEAFRPMRELSVDKLTIAGAAIVITGCAPDYSAVERLERALNRQPGFGEIKRSALPNCRSNRSNMRGFEFRVDLKE